MHFERFMVGVLFVWRITHLLNAEDGPGDVVVRLRRAAGEGFLGQALDCFYCLSMWTAVLPAILLGKKLEDRILLWPALSAGAILLERAVNQAEMGLPPSLNEESEDNHGMLWRKKSPIDEGDQGKPGA